MFFPKFLVLLPDGLRRSATNRVALGQRPSGGLGGQSHPVRGILSVAAVGVRSGGFSGPGSWGPCAAEIPFLQLPISERLPHPSSLCVFCGRLGREGFRQVFHKVIAIARSQGLVKDRLRLKDASHVIAHVAVPSALTLVAQIRDKLLAAAEPFDALRSDRQVPNLYFSNRARSGTGSEAVLLNF